MFIKYRSYIIGLFILLSALSGYYATQLKFSFSFDQFFPKGDPDLEFYKTFIADFESDDNFLLVAVENHPTVFDSSFLDTFHNFGLAVRELPYVTKLQSLTTIKNPVKTPFGYSAIPVIHTDQPERYAEDKRHILSDNRFVFNLIDSTATSLVIAAKTKEELDMTESRMLMDGLDSLTSAYGWQDKTHVLGRASFQRELVDFQKREMMLAFISSLILVTVIMVLIYRKPIGIIVSLGSIALGLLLFTGLLGAMGNELNAISALFPVIMLIVGSSDVIHIFSKYVDELNSGKDRETAMNITIKEIGLATFMTSFTTAIGFLSLTTSKLQTIQDFGINAAIGVMIAYVTVLFFTTSVLSLFTSDKIVRESYGSSRWKGVLNKIYEYSTQKTGQVFLISGVFLAIFILGMSMIGTNYNIEDNLPRGAKVTENFKFFEQHYAGFRPIEFAITAKNNHAADEYLVLKEVDKLQDKISSTGVIRSTISLATFYRTMNKMNYGNVDTAYHFPATEEEFYTSKKLLDKMAKDEATVLLSKDGTKTRVSGRIIDIGAEKIKELGLQMDEWVVNNLDSSIIDVRRTGTGLILDKNSEYVTTSLIQGLGISILIISVLMGFLFKSFRMVLIALIPNVLPLLFAASMLGYFNIELEAGVSIMFAIIFGIAVDDTIHFLSRYKLCLAQGMNDHMAIKKTIDETGKAIIFTSIILFFGFFNMIFSVNPPTFTVGLLISITLIGAVVCDLFLLPALLLRFMKSVK